MSEVTKFATGLADVTGEFFALRARLAEAERAIKAHNDACQDRCGRGDNEAVACGYRSYFVASRRRCTHCPTDEMIDYTPGLPLNGDERHG